MNLNYGPGVKPHEMYQGVDYQVFWEGVERQKLDELEDILVSQLLRLPARRLIDVGCGFGRLAVHYLDRCDQIVMLDGSTSLLKQARENTQGRALYVACDLYHIPFRPAAFDRVLNVRVFHHLKDGKTALAEFDRILAKDGEFVFNYSNKRNFARIISYIKGKRKINPFSIEPGYNWEGFIMHHPRHIRQMLGELGFTAIVERGAGIVDKLAGTLNRINLDVPPGAALAPLFAALEIAPWNFLRSEKHHGEELAAAASLDDLMCCLKCGGSLVHCDNFYGCAQCGRTYPVDDGIVNFLDAC